MMVRRSHVERRKAAVHISTFHPIVTRRPASVQRFVGSVHDETHALYEKIDKGGRPPSGLHSLRPESDRPALAKPERSIRDRYGRRLRRHGDRQCEKRSPARTAGRRSTPRAIFRRPKFTRTSKRERLDLVGRLPHGKDVFRTSSLVNQPKVDQFVRAMIGRFGNEAANIALSQTHAAVPKVAASWALIAARVADLAALQSTNDGTAGYAEPGDAAVGQRTTADQRASLSRLSPRHPPADPIPDPNAGR